MNRKSKSKYGDRFPMHRLSARKPVASKPAEMIPEVVSGTKIASLGKPVPTGDPR